MNAYKSYLGKMRKNSNSPGTGSDTAGIQRAKLREGSA